MYDKEAMEDSAQQAALVHSLGVEFLKEVPLTDGDVVLKTGFVAVFEQGDMQMDILLQGALCEKSPSFKALDVPLLSELASTHSDKVVKRLGGGVLNAGELDRKNWELFIDGAKVDLNAWTAWVTACSDRKTERFFKEQAWLRTRHNKCKAEASTLMDPSMPSRFTFKFKVWADTHLNWQVVEGVRAQLVASHVVHDLASVSMVGVLNWASMSPIPQATLRNQAELLGTLVNNGGNAGAVVMPVIGAAHGAAGQLWRPTSKAHELLYSVNLNADRYFMLCFDTRMYERSDRPDCLMLQCLCCSAIVAPSI